MMLAFAKDKGYLNSFIKKNYFIIFVIFSGIPVFFIPNVWDGLIFDYGFIIKNISGIEAFLKEIGSPFQLVFFYLIFFLKKITSISHEFLFDILTVITLILFSFEIKKYSQILFNFDNRWSNLCAIFAISFPVWHTLVAINLGLYLTCFYLALLGYRLFLSENLFIKIIGVIVILFSFSIKSNFSFVIGLSLAHNLRLFLNTQSIKKYSLFFIIFLCVGSYFVNINFFPPYGTFKGYNQIKFQNLDFITSIKNIYNYLTFFIFYLWIPAFYFFILKLKKRNIEFKNLFKKKAIGDYLVVIIIFVASIGPYILLNKSSDLFFFSDYQSRHAYLLAVSFGLFFSILLKKINDIYNIRKIYLLILTFFILQNLFILSVGYYTKVESALFRYDFIEKLKKIEEPPGGNVQIISSHAPGYLRYYEVNYLFYKAYGKASWWGSTHYNQELIENVKVPERLLKSSDYRTWNILSDYNQQCNIVMQLTNEINKFDRIFKYYILNFKDYFKIKVLKIDC